MHVRGNYSTHFVCVCVCMCMCVCVCSEFADFSLDDKMNLLAPSLPTIAEFDIKLLFVLHVYLVLSGL